MCRAPRSVQRTHAVWRVVWSRSTRRPRGYRSVPGMRPNKATSTSAEAEPYVQFQRTRLRNAARSRIGPLPIAIAWAAGDVPSHSSRPPSNPAPRRPALHGRYLELQGAPRGGWTCSFAYQPPTNNIFLSEHHQPTVIFSQNKSAITNQLAVLFSQNQPAAAGRPRTLSCRRGACPRRPVGGGMDAMSRLSSHFFIFIICGGDRQWPHRRPRGAPAACVSE
jgi:hypothetical protein